MDQELDAPEVNGRRLTYRPNVWAGPKLLVDGEPVTLKRGEVEVLDVDGTAHRIRMRTRPFDPSPTFHIGERTIETAPPLAWYQYAWCALPIVLVAVGGLLGGAVGAGAAYLNVHIFRSQPPESGARRYLLTGLLSVGAFALFSLVMTTLSAAVNR